MLRGFYNAAQAMLVHQRQLDIISNNVVNINTAGYRKDEAVMNTFMEEMVLVRGRTKTSNTFLQTYVDRTKANLEQGSFEYTESRFDMGIYGNVYFNIRSNAANDIAVGEEERILQTRNGQFELDSEGYLVLNDSGRVQGQNGDIYLGSDDFVVDADGVITNDNGVVDTLLLTYIPPDADIAKISDSLFLYEGGEELPEGETYDIIQGAFEKANVDAVKEMTQAMEIQRMYEANSKVLTAFDTINGRSVKILSMLRGG